MDSRWTPGRLHMDSMDFEMLQVHKHLDCTWNPGKLLQNSMDAPWSPSQPVAQYNDLGNPLELNRF